MILAAVGLIVPSFLILYETALADFYTFMGFGYLFLGFNGLFNTSGNFLGIYALDPRIFIIPGDWDGFNPGLNFAGISAEIFASGFFSNSINGAPDALSTYGLLFMLGMILSIVGFVLLLKKNNLGGALLTLAGILSIVAVIMFMQELDATPGFSGVLPIPIGSLLLLIAGILAFQEKP